MNIFKKSASIALLTIMLFARTAPFAKADILDDVFGNIKGSFSVSVSSSSDSISVVSTNSPAISVVKTKTLSQTYVVSATAYTSEVSETDSSPFITAKGTYVHDGIIAANFLPFGTAIKIPEVYGNKIFIVEDRMNSRYWHNIDIWMTSKDSAKQFGRKTVKIEIVS